MGLADPSARTLLDTDLLRSFVAIAETGSFTRAAERVLRTPAAVSMQIKKLEDTLGRQLFIREGRSVRLTGDGETLLGYGRQILALNEEAVAQFRKPALEGRVRFGAPDDFGTRFLPDILARFAVSCPHVQVDVTLEASVDLLDRFQRRELDVVLVTAGCPPNEPPGGSIVLGEPLVWVGCRHGCAHQREPLPLALADSKCGWRRMALDALDRAGRRYRVAYSSPHWAGQRAAVIAGLAVAPLPANLVAPPLKALGEEEGLPPIGRYHIAMHLLPDPSDAALTLARHVTESFDGLASTPPYRPDS